MLLLNLLIVGKIYYRLIRRLINGAPSTVDCLTGPSLLYFYCSRIVFIEQKETFFQAGKVLPSHLTLFLHLTVIMPPPPKKKKTTV